jgi:hypothetical protein
MHLQKKDDTMIKREFRARQNRQIVAIAGVLFTVLLGAVLHKRPDLFGTISRQTLFGLQAVSIAAFLGYTAHNWRCPACYKHLGGNINRQRCCKCGAWLQ